MCEHVWKNTGSSRERHVDLGTQRPWVSYVRCERCGQIGYTRGYSKVVYTWERTIIGREP